VSDLSRGTAETSLHFKRFAICAPAHKGEDSEKNQRISDLEKCHRVQLTHGVSFLCVLTHRRTRSLDLGWRPFRKSSKDQEATVPSNPVPVFSASRTTKTLV